MEEYTDAEICEIEGILNKRFLPLSGFEAKNLQICIEPRYFFNDSEGSPTEAYVATLFLTKDGKPLNFAPMPFTNKTNSKNVAFHLAHDVWGKFDRTLDSRIWKNFDPKTKEDINL